MGNSISSNSGESNKEANKEFNNFYEVIDYIASHYILTMDFKSLSKLSEKDYCNKLVILTSDIINKYFNDMEVTFLAQRVKNGVIVNDLKKENVSFINKDELEGLDISNDTQKSIKKKRVCIGIAKFYVKIAHIFAAIVMTINPVYTYKDNTGQTVHTGLLQKDNIPKNTKRKISKYNICDNRIRALKQGEIYDFSGNVTIQPKVCNMNINKDGTVKNLKDEPGIPEFLNLYFDDNYDYSNGTFTGMSEKTKAQFLSDLKLFYTTFTGNEVMPPEITKFSDIKLRDYRNLSGCLGQNSVLKSKVTLNKNNELFIKYANNIKNMINDAANNQYKLLYIINELFIFVKDPYSEKKVIRVNPNLTDELLQNIVFKTRKYIINLYLKCETDYVNGMKIFEAIVEQKIFDTTQKQIQTLKSKAKQIIDETRNTFTPVKPLDNTVTNEPTDTTTTEPTNTTTTEPTNTTTEPTNTITTEPLDTTSSDNNTEIIIIKHMPTITTTTDTITSDTDIDSTTITPIHHISQITNYDDKFNSNTITHIRHMPIIKRDNTIDANNNITDTTKPTFKS